jgi:hypothetical protein
MRCDICNASVRDGAGAKVSAERFRRLLALGFGIDPANVEMLTSSGMPKAQAVEMLKQQYMMSSSDWLLCPSCAKAAVDIARQAAPNK